jgi:hypothetical protein
MDSVRKFLASVSASFSRFIDGRAPSDPFYLSNRTFAQKLRPALIIGVPGVLLALGIGLAVTGYFDKPVPLVSSQPNLTPEQVAAKMLPNLDKNLKVEQNHDVEVADVHIEQSGGTKVAGTVRNTTAHVIQDPELVFDLTDAAGSRLGAVSTRIPKIDARSSAPFSFPVPQKNAAFALVREVRQ